jgi:DNA polymerase V
MNKVIAVIDLKSFYASCECACRHLDIFTTPLVCCDPYRSSSSVVMSATPYLKKKYGIPNVCRRRDLPEVKGMIYAVPRMSYYLQMSAKVVSIFLDFVAEEDLHVYSVDESFLNLGPYLNLYHSSPEESSADSKDD